MSSGPDAKRFCFLTVRFCLNIYQINAKCINIFLLQNASICTISTHFASIFFMQNASTLPTHFVTKKNQNVTIVTLVQNALYQCAVKDP